MKVGFFHASTGPATHHVELARILIASVRRSMPGVEVVHLTDTNTPAIDGVDAVQRRYPGPIALSVLEHYAECRGEWLLVDTDVVIQRDVRHVFDDALFDIAVVTREGTLKGHEVGRKFMNAMPFNKGVVYSRSDRFWRAAANALGTAHEKNQSWMGDQRAMNDLIASNAFVVKVLPASYNYPPKSQREDLREHFALHFKGPRKAWMTTHVC